MDSPQATLLPLGLLARAGLRPGADLVVRARRLLRDADEAIAAVQRHREGQVGRVLTLDLKYGPNRERSIAGLRRVSKPGLRVYAKSTGLPRVLGGLGVAILSTSSGLLTDRQAAKRGVGGEVLAYVW